MPGGRDFGEEVAEEAGKLLFFPDDPLTAMQRAPSSCVP
jgi:hypothetical protein